MGACQLKITLSGLLWLTLALSCSLWLTLVLSCSLWLSLAHSSSLWITSALFDSLWLSLSGSLSHILAHCDSVWLTLSLSLWQQFIPPWSTFHLFESIMSWKKALIIWLILGGIYVIGKCSTRAFNVKQIIFYSQRFMWTRSWEFMLQKAIWNLYLKNMYPIWDIYSIKFQFEMHILLSEFISPPASTWLLQSNQPSQSSQISRQVQHMYFCRLIQMYL